MQTLTCSYMHAGVPSLCTYIQTITYVDVRTCSCMHIIAQTWMHHHESNQRHKLLHMIIHAHVHTQIHTLTYASTQIHTCTCVHTNTHMRTHVHSPNYVPSPCRAQDMQQSLGCMWIRYPPHFLYHRLSNCAHWCTVSLQTE